ncbi:MAG TPA: hypothetical protein PKC18_10950 [Lacipirellulaceae bacterium]|nr:hypothetical protein [Lacipirellulaceae bacterium]
MYLPSSLPFHAQKTRVVRRPVGPSSANFAVKNVAGSSGVAGGTICCFTTAPFCEYPWLG